MERIVNQDYAELISKALSAVPDKILELIKPVHFFTGTDPIYAGLEIEEDISDGRSCKYTMHYLPEDLQLHLPKCLRCPTIVMPVFPEMIGDIVHELGHALTDRLPYAVLPDYIEEVTDYAKTNFDEAFAEAFSAWLFWDYGNTIEPNEETLALFERLRFGNHA